MKNFGLIRTSIRIMLVASFIFFQVGCTWQPVKVYTIAVNSCIEQYVGHVRHMLFYDGNGLKNPMFIDNYTLNIYKELDKKELLKSFELPGKILDYHFKLSQNPSEWFYDNKRFLYIICEGDQRNTLVTLGFSDEYYEKLDFADGKDRFLEESYSYFNILNSVETDSLQFACSVWDEKAERFETGIDVLIVTQDKTLKIINVFSALGDFIQSMSFDSQLYFFGDLDVAIADNTIYEFAMREVNRLEIEKKRDYSCDLDISSLVTKTKRNIYGIGIHGDPIAFDKDNLLVKDFGEIESCFNAEIIGNGTFELVQSKNGLTYIDSGVLKNIPLNGYEILCLSQHQWVRGFFVCSNGRDKSVLKYLQPYTDRYYETNIGIFDDEIYDIAINGDNEVYIFGKKNIYKSINVADDTQRKARSYSLIQ